MFYKITSERPLLKWAIYLSILLNIAFLYKISKDFYKGYKQSHPSEEVVYLFNRQTVYENLAIDKQDVVFIGDSHTQKFELHEFFHQINVKNRGIDGDITAGVLERLALITKGHPEKIFLQIGINDIFMRHDIIKAVPNYERIISRIKAESPATKIYVQSIMPSKFASQDTVIKYNEALKEISRKNNLTFIDLYSTFNHQGVLDERYDCGDGIHLNGAGYVAWTKILQPYL